MRDILIIGLIIAVIIILIRIAFGTPLIKRVMESFTSSIQATPECPMGTKFYMHNNKAFCCSGKIKTAADTAADTCSTFIGKKEDLTFCTLGPRQKDIPNCSEINEQILREEGKRVCPPSAPNYVRGNRGIGRCCAGPANAERTDCMSTLGSCDVAPSGTNILKTAQPSCQLRKLKEDTNGCPPSYSTSMMLASEPNNWIFTGFNIPFCKNISTNKMCYTKPIKDKIKELKWEDYDTGIRREFEKYYPNGNRFTEDVGRFMDSQPQC